jgi:hypothetical protein
MIFHTSTRARFYGRLSSRDSAAILLIQTLVNGALLSAIIAAPWSPWALFPCALCSIGLVFALYPQIRGIISGRASRANVGRRRAKPARRRQVGPDAATRVVTRKFF